MAVTETLSEGLKRDYEVIITKKEIDKLVDQKLESIAKEANLPGFRPGKVPVSVVKNRFGKQVLGEVVRESVDAATKDAMDKNKLRNKALFIGLLKFLLVSSLPIIANVGVTNLFYSKFSTNTFFSQLLGIFVVFIWNYAASSKVVWNN